MPSIRVDVSVLVDNQPVRGFPISRTLSVDELQVAAPYEKATGAGFADLPIGEVATKQFVLLQADKAVTYQFANGTTGNVAMNANGLMLLLDCNHATDIEIENTSGSTAKVTVQVGGT